jgi:hypothetical protein
LPLSLTALSVPSVVDIVTDPRLDVMVLPNESVSWSVQLDVLDPFAAIDVGLQSSVDRAGENPPTVVVIVVEPETEPSAAVTACETPASVPTVKTTVASPLLFVGVADENDPPLVLDQVTERPGIVTALSFASSSRARIVTDDPTCVESELVVTWYFAAGPATNWTLALPLVIGAPSRVAAIVALPTVFGAVKVAA